MRHRHDSFHHRRMRQLRQPRDDIPDGIQSFFFRLHVRPNQHEPAVHLGLGFFQAAIFRHGFAAHRQQQFLRLQRLFLSILIGERHRHTFGILLHRFHFAAGVNLNVFLAEALVQLRGNFFVFHRHDSRQRFQNRDSVPKEL